MQVGRLDDARKVVEDIWGASEAEKAMEEMKAVVMNDDSQASWSELLSEPHSRGCFHYHDIFLRNLCQCHYSLLEF
jgi:hypothetical protein